MYGFGLDCVGCELLPSKARGESHGCCACVTVRMGGKVGELAMETMRFSCAIGSVDGEITGRRSSSCLEG